MPTPRDQLIADWRKRLAGISGAPEEVTSRAAWLARLRRRLYRFLLSLYGQGDWNAPAEAELHPASFDRTQVRRGSPDPAAAPTEGLPLDLVGKPAKDFMAIRAVLKSVAGASESIPPAGPLAAGIGREGWVVVASTSRGFDPERAAAALLAQGIVPRVIPHRHDVTVEVRAFQAQPAEACLDARRAQLIVYPRSALILSSPPTKGTSVDFLWPLLFLGLGMGPVVAFFTLLMLGLAQPESMDLSVTVHFLWLVGYIWLGSLSVIGLLHLFLGLRRKSRPRSSR